MRGHLTERRPGVWRLVVSAGFGPDGKRRQKVATVRGGRRDAERVLRKMLDDRDEGRLAQGRQPLERYLEDWVQDVSAVSRRGTPLAPTTRQRYRDAVRHISREIGRVRLCDVRASHVEHLRDALLGRGLGAESVSGIMRVLSQALARAEAKELVGRNWADASLVHRPAGRPADFTIIDPELGGRILAASRGTDPWDAAVHLALGLGLRREEVLGLQWQDVSDGLVHVRRTLTAASGELHVGPPKSAAGRRDLPMPDFVAAALRRHKAAQAERLLAIGTTSELVVDNGIGQPWQPATFSGAWRDFAAEHGFSGVTFHTLRHGAATLLLASGAPDAVAAAIMGHADTKILRRYQDVVAELKRDAATGMDMLLGRQM